MQIRYFKNTSHTMKVSLLVIGFIWCDMHAFGITIGNFRN